MRKLEQKSHKIFSCVAVLQEENPSAFDKPGAARSSVLEDKNDHEGSLTDGRDKDKPESVRCD